MAGGVTDEPVVSSTNVYDLDFAKLPPVLPATVAVVTDEGLAAREFLDWQEYTRRWFKDAAENLQKRNQLVEAEFGNAYASFREDIEVIAGNQLAQATQVTTLTARVGANEASVEVERLARQTADASVASQVTTLSSQLGTNTATLQNVQQSVNGIGVRYGVVGTINGVTGGFMFEGIRRNDGSVTYGLEINANVTINGNLVVNGSINSDKLGGLSDMKSADGPDASVAVTTKQGGRVLVLVSVEATGAQTPTFFSPVNAGPVSIPVFLNGAQLGTLTQSMRDTVTSYNNTTDGTGNAITVPNGWALSAVGGSSAHFVADAPGTGSFVVYCPASSVVANSVGGYGGLVRCRVTAFTIAK